MPNYHFSVQAISRATGRSAVACAAYRANVRLKDERIGRVFDYSPRDAACFAEVMLPKGAPERFADRSALWNEVERVERRKDAQLAREVEVSLPRELSKSEDIELAREFVDEAFTKRGMVADVCMHVDMEWSNPHLHIMLTMRSIEGDAFGKKNRDWNDKDLLKEWRVLWEQKQNAALERCYEREQTPEIEREYVDCRTYEEQGIERVPQVHEGPTVREIERKAEIQAANEGREYEPVTEVRAANVEVAERNDMIARIEQALEELRNRAEEVCEKLQEQAQSRLGQLRDQLKSRIGGAIEQARGLAASVAKPERTQFGIQEREAQESHVKPVAERHEPMPAKEPEPAPEPTPLPETEIDGPSMAVDDGIELEPKPERYGLDDIIRDIERAEQGRGSDDDGGGGDDGSRWREIPAHEPDDGEPQEAEPEYGIDRIMGDIYGVYDEQEQDYPDPEYDYRDYDYWPERER